VVVGIVLTLLSAQLVAPTRRFRLRRGTVPDGATWGTPAAVTASDAHPTVSGDLTRVPADAPLPTDEVTP